MKSNEKAFFIGVAVIGDLLFHEGKMTTSILKVLTEKMKEDDEKWQEPKDITVICEKCNCKLYIGRAELLNLSNLPQVCRKGGCHTLKIITSDER